MIQTKSHKNRRLTIKRKSKKILNEIISNIKYISGFFVIGLIFLGIYFGGKKLLFNDSNQIKTVTIANENVYINKTIKTTIDNFLIGNNYYIAKLNKYSLLGNLIDKNITIIKDLHIDKKGKNISVTIDYQSPALALSIGNTLWGYNSGYFFELSSQYSIYSGNTVVNIKTFSGDDVSAVFFETSPEALMQQINNIYSKIPVKDNFRIPSAYKIGITTEDDKLLYFDVKKNIFEQIKKYEFIKNNYKKYKNTTEMDLGTIDDSIFIK